jgi:uncharacterized protein
MKPAFTLPSSETTTEYVIYIDAPTGADAAEPCPAVIFMDGDDQFSAALAAYKSARKSHGIRPLLLVGVGYGAGYSKPQNKRGRDYTPTPHSDEPTSGGAAAFCGFLIHSLWPELERRYSLRDDQRAIAGHSLGSLLALYALWREPLFFTHCLASAPSIWWDNRSLLKVIDQRHAKSPALPARLYLSVGENDSASMTGDLTLLEQQLRTRPFEKLEITSRRFPRRNHFNVIPDAFHDGLVSLFGNPAPAR